jgi:hypothetical protein
MLNRAWAAIFSSGVAPDYLATSEVTGRKSGRTISLLLVVTILDGQRGFVINPEVDLGLSRMNSRTQVNISFTTSPPISVRRK